MDNTFRDILPTNFSLRVRATLHRHEQRASCSLWTIFQRQGTLGPQELVIVQFFPVLHETVARSRCQIEGNCGSSQRCVAGGSAAMHRRNCHGDPTRTQFGSDWCRISRVLTVYRSNNMLKCTAHQNVDFLFPVVEMVHRCSPESISGHAVDMMNCFP